VASLAATTAATLAATTDTDTHKWLPSQCIIVTVEGLGKMHDRSDEEERGGHTAPDLVPLAARIDDSSTPHVPAILVEMDMTDERDETVKLARWRFRNMTVVESVHALPAGNEEEVETEATNSSSQAWKI
jgi:hypothetical protein